VINLQDWVKRPVIKLKDAKGISVIEYDYIYELITFIRNGISDLLSKNSFLSPFEETEIYDDLIIKSDLAIFIANMFYEGSNIPQNEVINSFLKASSQDTYIDVFIPTALHNKLALLYLSKEYHYSTFIFTFFTLEELNGLFKPSSSIDSYIHKNKSNWDVYGLVDYTNRGDVEIYEKATFYWHSPLFVYIKNVYVTTLELKEYLTNASYALQLPWEYYPYLSFNDPLLYEEDVCQPCKEKLKWINLYLQCPNCKKLYG